MMLCHISQAIRYKRQTINYDIKNNEPVTRWIYDKYLLLLILPVKKIWIQIKCLKTLNFISSIYFQPE